MTTWTSAHVAPGLRVGIVLLMLIAMVTVVFPMVVQAGGGAGFSQGPITLRVALQKHHVASIGRSTVERIEQKLSRSHGRTVRIIVEEQPSDPVVFRALLRHNYLQASHYFDIYEISSTWAAEMADSFVDLAEGSRLVEDLCSTSSGDSACDYEPHVLKTFTVEGTGALVAVPWRLDVGVLYYRKDLIGRLVQDGKVGLSLIPALSSELIS